MALTPVEQAFDALSRSNRPLIVLPAHAAEDEFASALALAENGRVQNKTIEIVSAASFPSSLSFLKKNQDIRSSLGSLRRFALEVDLSRVPIQELSYEQKEGKLRVLLTPKSNLWKQEEVAIKPESYKHDLVIAIGTPDRESLGPLFAAERDFFFETPTILIDHRPENSRFGHYDLADVTAASCAEVCYRLLTHKGAKVNADIATLLLTGIIAKTRSFTKPQTTPRTLDIAGALMSAGADRDRIGHELFRTRSVADLRLWGRALARLVLEKDIPLVWSAISQQDLLQSGVPHPDLSTLARELMMSSKDARLSLIFLEEGPQMIRVSLLTEAPLDARLLLEPFGGIGHREEARATITSTISDAVERVRTSVAATMKRLYPSQT